MKPPPPFPPVQFLLFALCPSVPLRSLLLSGRPEDGKVNTPIPFLSVGGLMFFRAAVRQKRTLKGITTGRSALQTRQAAARIILEACDLLEAAQELHQDMICCRARSKMLTGCVNPERMRPPESP